jgi:hypothetical protein
MPAKYNLREQYLYEVNAEIARCEIGRREVITENDIARLPLPVQRYFRVCGYIGKEKMAYAITKWKDVYFRMSPGKKWMSIDCYQFNAVQSPVRIVYMKSQLAGIFPFEGRDKYQNGHGNMLIKLLKLFTIANVRGREMDISALVTVLSETFLTPTYALQPYLEWTSVDEYSAKAQMQHNGTTVEGQFYFNDAGEFTRFETNDRYKTVGKKYEKCKWSVTVGNYVEKNGVRFPANASASWHDKNGTFEYFKGCIENIAYNIPAMDFLGSGSHI